MALSQAVLDHIDKVVASWPSPTPEQVRRTIQILYPDLFRRSLTPSESPEALAKRNAQEAVAAAQKQFEDALAGCRACGISRVGHQAQQGYGLGFHAFEPLSPEDTIKVARAAKRKIAATEKALHELTTPEPPRPKPSGN